jgi:hypothetical protein
MRGRQRPPYGDIVGPKLYEEVDVALGMWR